MDSIVIDTLATAGLLVATACIVLFFARRSMRPRTYKDGYDWADEFLKMHSHQALAHILVVERHRSDWYDGAFERYVEEVRKNAGTAQCNN